MGGPWQTAGAAVRGSAHAEAGRPCQDAFAASTAGPWLVAAVCDGAGSARHADVGATVGAGAVVEALTVALSAGGPDGPTAMQPATIRAAIEAAREAVGAALHARLGLRPATLDAAHATLVGVAATASGGLLFHVGDGLGAAVTAAGTVVSPPENGTYANETFFFTEPDWAPHLRLTPFDGPVETLLLMSDGAAALATAPGGRLLDGFVRPITSYLGTVPREVGEAALRDTLAHERTDALTDDDKTVFWARPRPTGP